MADDAANDEAGALGTALLAPGTAKLIDAANVHIKAGQPALALSLYFGAVSRMVGVAAAHIGVARTVEMLEICIGTLRNVQRRSHH